MELAKMAHPGTNSFAVTLGIEFRTTRQDVNFVTSFPADDSTMFCLKLSDLSFSPASSTKPAPYLTPAISLLQVFQLSGNLILLRSPQGSSEGVAQPLSACTM